MNAKEFIATKGNITDPNIRFLVAGEVRTIPLEELLNEYTSQCSPMQEAVKVQEVKPKKITKKNKA